MRKKTFHTMVSFIEGRETIINFSYVPGAPARGPSYSSGGEPADPPEIEFESVQGNDQYDIDNACMYLESDQGYEQAVEKAEEDLRNEMDRIRNK